jgi:tetratricopeptide (TPR) repeat protein
MAEIDGEVERSGSWIERGGRSSRWGLWEGVGIFLCLWLGTAGEGVRAQSTGGGGAGQGATPPAAGRTAPVTHTIRGRLYLPSGTLPDQRMRVVLQITSGGMVGETFTDTGGNFEFSQLPSGTYQILVPADQSRQFETTQETVELFGAFSRTVLAQVNLRGPEATFQVVPKGKLLSVGDLQEVPREARKLYEKGLKRAEEKKPTEAIPLFQKALQQFPDYLLAINKLGEQYLILERHTEARAQFDRALLLQPKFVLPRLNLGILHVGLRQYDEAIEELEAGCRLEDGYPMAHLNLGIAYLSRQTPDVERAEKEFARAITLGGRPFASGRKILFNWFLRQDQLARAADQLEAYLEVAGGEADAEEVRQVLKRIRQRLTARVSP